MSKETYQKVEECINLFLEGVIERYPKVYPDKKNFLFQYRERLKEDSRVKDLEMRLRWDIWHHSKAYLVIPKEENLTDDQIDTALKRIFKK